MSLTKGIPKLLFEAGLSEDLIALACEWCLGYWEARSKGNKDFKLTSEDVAKVEGFLSGLTLQLFVSGRLSSHSMSLIESRWLDYLLEDDNKKIH